MKDTAREVQMMMLMKTETWYNDHLLLHKEWLVVADFAC